MRHLGWKSFLKQVVVRAADPFAAVDDAAIAHLPRDDLPARLERLGTRSEGPDGLPGGKLFFKFFTTCAGWRIFTTDLSHGKDEIFFALHKRFGRATFLLTMGVDNPEGWGL
ncbi:hypothetical protein [Bradyrhizobium tropiciagri]|uniref:hypothetical protein n=1 Tax=Bradyrhizobium tropiciagri TaxID=312253 RepID=UPI00067E518F|nr:hypothetical protein [Bradyrhizobium tropiciagri]